MAAGPAALLELWREAPEYRALLAGLAKGYREQALFGLQPGQAPFLAAALRRDSGRPLLVLTAGLREATALAADLAAWCPDEAVALFPPVEIVPYHVVARSPEVAAQRLRVLADLAAGRAGVVVAPVAAALRALPPAEAFRAATVTLAVGQEADPEALAARLAAAGYERVERVEAPGQFSRRGGLVDVFPLTRLRPCRVEFAGDEVVSLRPFDPASQRSTGAEERVEVPPAREAVVPPGQGARAAAAVRAELEQACLRLERAGRGPAARLLRERVEGHLARFDPSLWELYLPYVHEGVSLLDYFPAPPLLLAWEGPRVLEALEAADRQWGERTLSLLEEGRLLPRQTGLQLPAAAWREAAGRCPAIYAGGLAQRLPGVEARAVLSVGSKPVTAYRGQWELFLDELRGYLGQGYRCCLAAAGAEAAARRAAALTEAGIPPAGTGWAPPPPGGVAVWPLALQGGFVFPGLRLLVVTEGELAGRRRQPAPAPAGVPEGVRVASYQDLQVGDYVVHVQHGIGQYLGIKTLAVQGVQRDYLFIKYDGQDRLYVPTDQIHLVQKYVGGEGVRPRLHRLGGGEWQRAKQRVRASVRRLAEELLQLYAARQSLPGHAFGPDTVWQREFEDAFPYEETPDQLRAIAEIKRDMEQPRPMDRLLCGDVGFGKTEVAMRAAFKAVMDGKQVAVLVPTTVLAQQHYLTFKERCERFPVRIEMLSRFRTPKEQEAVITALRKGEVDIVIGTHRLLGPDVNFRDLGLLIVDEEHRFGVAHKEALKRLRATVDVLTMTATPIPRTLHLALTGLRDMSVIATPPEDRYPVETYVVEYDEALVRDAVERELARGGQVFYVHNRVHTIGGALRRLRALVPDADIGVAHGQMPEEELERVMLAFLEGRHDILLCTSIIESGLDIPNANTLVVEDADRFGLAQLYQIRGRVGRSNRLAYAYFTYRGRRVLGEKAARRLEAIKEFTELGSGFKIALRDLEIRGAGDILGPEQHGFIVSVGFDLYRQLLEETVRELRGEREAPRTEPVLELPVDAYLDDSYVPEGRAKIEIYKRVNGARTPAEVDDLEAELRDRYGPLPPPARNLIALARVRVAAADLGALAVTRERDAVRVTFPPYMKDLLRGAERLRAAYGRRLAVQPAPRPTLRLRLEGAARFPGEAARRERREDGAAVLAEVLALLAAVAGLPEVERWRAQGQPAAAGEGR